MPRGASTQETLESSPTLGSLGPSHQRRHKSRVSLRDRSPLCALCFGHSSWRGARHLCIPKHGKGYIYQSPTLGAHTHGFWVGMSGHRICASLHPAPNWSQTSRMQGIRWPRSTPGWSQRQWTTFYLPDPTKIWCRRVTHITQFLNTWALFEYIAWVCMGGHKSLLMVMVWVWVQIRRKMLGSNMNLWKTSRFTSTLVCKACMEGKQYTAKLGNDAKK
jgi:hypothetical protein